MVHLGRICKFFESKGYGFIESTFDSVLEWQNRNRYEKKNNNIFFHIKDCSFTQIVDVDWVTYEIHEHNGKCKAVKIKAFNLTTGFDHLFNNWSNYNFSLQNKILSELEDIFSYQEVFYLSYSDEDSIFSKNFSKLQKSIKRNNIINAAKRIAGRLDMCSKSKSLHDFLCSILERFNIEEIDFTQGCKDIIDKTLHNAFQDNFKELENEMSNVPTREVIKPAVISFLQNLKPTISYTYEFEEGYWSTRWKWDGSEDSYNHPRSSSKIECSLEHFTFRGTTIYWGYYEDGFLRNNEDEMDKNEIFMEVYSNLLNSRKFWNVIIYQYQKKEIDLLLSFINKTCESALKEIMQYLNIIFPKYGKTMFDWAEAWVKKHNFYIDGMSIKFFLLNKTPLPNILKKFQFINNGNKYEKYDRPEITGVNVVNLKKDLLDIYLYLYQNLISIIENRYTSHVQLNAYDSEVINENNITLSYDRKTLLSVDNNCTEISIPKTVTQIHDGALDDCKNLTKINFTGPITHIGNHVFRNVKLEIIGDFSHLTYIGFNRSHVKLSINGVTKTITEWSYYYNKHLVDNTIININKEYIRHDDD